MNHPWNGVLGQYLAVASLAGMDTVCGGIRSGQEGKFRTDIFITGFISNVLIATLLSWIGDKIFIDLYLAVALLLGWRIFTNLSLIRRSLVTEWHDKQEKVRSAKALAKSSNSPLPGSISAAQDAQNTF